MVHSSVTIYAVLPLEVTRAAISSLRLINRYIIWHDIGLVQSNQSSQLLFLNVWSTLQTAAHCAYLATILTSSVGLQYDVAIKFPEDKYLHSHQRLQWDSSTWLFSEFISSNSEVSQVGMGKVELLGVPELFLNSTFRIQNFEPVLMKLEALRQNSTTKDITNLITDNSITKHAYYSATISSNLYVLFSTQF